MEIMQQCHKIGHIYILFVTIKYTFIQLYTTNYYIGTNWISSIFLVICVRRENPMGVMLISQSRVMV
jgi:hypothetical protein